MLYLPSEFPLDDKLAYLNHAAVAPLPRRSATALANFAFENMTQGATNYPQWMKQSAQLKQRLMQLINADTVDDIALVKNTSEGLSIVAHGLTWKDGDEIVGIANEFPSNAVVWESLTDQGVRFNPVDTNKAADPEQALFDACNENTRMLAISTIHYASGLRLNMERISAFCQDRQILLCVDAIQSIGALDFDLRKTPADFVTADGHKWMLGPEGLGFLYVKPELRSQLKLHQFGWAMRANPGNYDAPEWSISPTASRFEAGTPNMAGIHALNESIGLLLEFGMQEVQNRVLENRNYLTEKLSHKPTIKVLSSSDADRTSGIVLFDVISADNQQIHQKLMQDGVICAWRGGGIRFSPHFYNTADHMDRALERLENAIKT